ncbi:hypothetical protein ACGFNU_36520 [Spirillospora sp. NPDC048911]|uniref:hypothetical protein n=1 Tax=Spirillospora sp. NPDC048911 TaxID=3364527 RepID=UPI00371E15B5
MSQSPSLGRGRHRTPGGQVCVMELVSVLSGEPWSDHPRCVDPVLAAVARTVNDAVTAAAREQLAALAPQMIGTAPSSAATAARLVARCAATALKRPPRDESLRYALEWDLRNAHRRLRRGPKPAARRWAGLLERLYVHSAAMRVVVAVRAATAHTPDDELLALLRECIADLRAPSFEG